MHALRALGEEEVLGLDVAVDDPDCVRSGERLAHLHHVLDCKPHGKLPLLVQELTEVLPVEVLHHDERHAVRQVADVEHARDVFALDPRRRARLGREAHDQLLVRERFASQELERHRFPEIDVPRRDHETHPAGSDQVTDLVLSADDLASRERQLDRLFGKRFHARTRIVMLSVGHGGFGDLSHALYGPGLRHWVLACIHTSKRRRLFMCALGPHRTMVRTLCRRRRISAP